MFKLIIFIVSVMTKDITKAGTIPVLEGKIVFVSSMKHKGTFVLPKGHIEKNESRRKTALRETKEESGLVGVLDEQEYVLGNTAYFILQVTDKLEEFEERNKRSQIILSWEQIKKSTVIKQKIKKLLQISVFAH